MKKRGRPRSDISQKREALLLSAAELFHSFGFDKVSIEEICEKASTSKMTFYRQFHDKADIGLCLIEKSSQEAKQAVQNILGEKFHFSEKFKLLMALNGHYREKLGLRFLEDLTRSNDPKLIQGIKNISKRMEQLNFQFIEMGKSEGFLNPDFKLEFIMFMIEKVNTLFKDPRLTHIYPDFSEQIKKVTEFFYFGITAKKE